MHANEGRQKRYGDFYKPRKARFIPTFCKRINRTSTAVGRWVTAFEERRRTTFSVTNSFPLPPCYKVGLHDSLSYIANI